jgi:hypothetical protein
MSWLQQNWQLAGCIAAVVMWLLQNFGKAAFTKVRDALASLKPKVDSKTTIFSAWPLLVFALLLGPKLIPAANPVAPVAPQRVPDIVDRCGIAGRALLADALEEFAGQKFDNDKAREDAINEKIEDVIEASFVPLNHAIAAAIKANRVKDCADKIRKGELRE